MEESLCSVHAIRRTIAFKEIHTWLKTNVEEDTISNKRRYGSYDAARTDELHIHFSGSDMLKDRYQPSLYIVTAHFTAALLNNSLPCKHFTAYIRVKKGCVLVISSGYTVNTELRRANAASNLRR